MIGTERAAQVMLTGDQFSIYPGVSQYPGRHWLKTGMSWIEGADYTHAWVGFKVEQGQVPLIYQSTGIGVHVDHWSNFVNSRIVKHMWEIPLSEEEHLRFVNQAFYEHGKRYGNRQLFGIAAIKFLEYVSLGKLKIKRYPKFLKPNRNTEHVCSETAGRATVDFTPVTWEEINRDPDFFTPKDHFGLCEYLEDQGYAARRVTDEKVLV